MSNPQFLCFRISSTFIKPLSASQAGHRFLNRSSSKHHSLNRYYSSESDSPPQSRSTLTLDDVLPPSQSQTSINQRPKPLIQPVEQQPKPRYDRYQLGEPHSRYSPRSFGAMRTPFELSSDPIRRRSGERTSYSLIIKSTSNNTRLTLTHTPISNLPGSWSGHAEYQKAFPMAGAIIARVTAGSVGFKRGKRQEYEAATQATLAMFKKIKELISQGSDSNLSGIGSLINSTEILTKNSVSSIDVNKRSIKEGLPRELEIVFDGFGNGRDAFMSSLMGAQGIGIRELIRSVRDKTILKIGGPRPKKRRRV
ncbi:hypothetical protein DFH28DRAFT_628240 [Melampsora americana]|nr:hypothetical protein DFH28DRAFT_628240 [Melampsora americana]